MFKLRGREGGPRYATACIMHDYTIPWLLCAFSLVVDHNVLKAHIEMTSNPCQRTCFYFFMSQISLNFYCIKQIDYIIPCVCTVINRRRRHSVYRTTITPLDFVSCRIFCSLRAVIDVICYLLQYTHKEKCNLFVK